MPMFKDISILHQVEQLEDAEVHYALLRFAHPQPLTDGHPPQVETAQGLGFMASLKEAKQVWAPWATVVKL